MDSEDPLLVLGLFLIYQNSVQIRGRSDTIQKFIDGYNLNGKNVTLPLGFKEYIFERYNHFEAETVIHRMIFDENRFTNFDKIPYIYLSSKNREEIATLLRTADPIWWNLINAENLTMEDDRVWIGINKKNKTIAAVSAWIHKFAGNIATVATDIDNRRQGYASSLVSAIIKIMLQKTNTILIHVRSDNLPAINVYSKCGFIDGKKYYMVKNLQK